jgi:hypothetical protein
MGAPIGNKNAAGRHKGYHKGWYRYSKTHEHLQNMSRDKAFRKQMSKIARQKKSNLKFQLKMLHGFKGSH